MNINIFVFVFCAFFLSAEAKSFGDGLIVQDKVIKRGEKVIGKIESSEKTCLYGSEERANLVDVKIYNKFSKLIASYVVMVKVKDKAEMRKMEKEEEKENMIVEASLQTYMDRALNNGANFLNYSEYNKNEKVPQLSKVLEYLTNKQYL